VVPGTLRVKRVRTAKWCGNVGEHPNSPPARDVSHYRRLGIVERVKTGRNSFSSGDVPTLVSNGFMFGSELLAEVKRLLGQTIRTSKETMACEGLAIIGERVAMEAEVSATYAAIHPTV
jgi:hypothetical protein